jgi:hypothetical protein
LKKALYKLKQAPRAWNYRIDGYLSQKGFIRFPYEHLMQTNTKHCKLYRLFWIFIPYRRLQNPVARHRWNRKVEVENFTRLSNACLFICWWYNLHGRWSYYDLRFQAIHGEEIWNDRLRSHGLLFGNRSEIV